jgi:hypothetical protein
MSFIFHLLLFLHGAFGLVVTKLRVHPAYDLMPDNILNLFTNLWPETVFPVWKKGEAESIPDTTQALAVSAAQVAYSAWYLHSKHRTT